MELRVFLIKKNSKMRALQIVPSLWCDLGALQDDVSELWHYPCSRTLSYIKVRKWSWYGRMRACF